jgi:tRNA threonylcarbamoyladenosine biosynthesis protein TsaB
VALWQGGRLRASRAGDGSRLHAVRLPDTLVAILGEHGLAWTDVTRLAVLSGPGGFTGLRVGLATIQGLGLALGVDVVALSTLEVIAVAARRLAPECTRAGAWMQGMRGEVFTAVYDVQRGHEPTELRAVVPPVVGVPADAAAQWPPGVDGQRVAVAGDAWALSGDVLRAATPGTSFVPVEAPPLAGVLAELAASPHAVVSPSREVLPTYIRRPDAVLTRLQAGLPVTDVP